MKLWHEPAAPAHAHRLVWCERTSAQRPLRSAQGRSAGRAHSVHNERHATAATTFCEKPVRVGRGGKRETVRHRDLVAAGLRERVCNDFEARLVEFDGEDDHVHLLLSYPPKVALSALVNSLKGVSSRLLRKEFPVLRKRYWKGVLWSPSYFAASCGGAPLSIIEQYIENQRTPL